MRALLIAAVLSLAPMAVAAQTPPHAPAATPEQVQSARQEADALLGQSGVADLFDNVTDDASPAVRHRASGLRCTFNAGEALNRVMTFPSAMPRGDDVGCNTEEGGTSTTLYATRFPEPTSVADQVAVAVGHIRTRFPDAQPTEGPGISMEANRPGAARLPQHQSATLVVTAPNGRRLVTRVVVAIVDGWVIKQRHSAPADDVMAAQLMSEMMFNLTLSDIVEHRTARR